mmetsp:Transcript_22926/g.53655  ORF Transcript_22926/g.53655 Transcript_22926/m.53655 type:complete len:245 (-) Transcript_22926:183-917(-)
MLRIGLVFELGYAETQPGEKVYVVGNHPALGNWQLGAKDVRETQELRTGPGLYPQWANLNTVWLAFDKDAAFSEGNLSSCYNLDDIDENLESASTPSSPRSPDGTLEEPTTAERERELICVEYKFVKDRSGGRLQWEDKIPNRRVYLPRQQGTIWVVRDGCFNDGHQVKVSRTSLPEVAQRLYDLHELDPEWTTRSESDMDEPEYCQVANARKIPALADCDVGSTGGLTYLSGHTTSTKKWPPL